MSDQQIIQGISRRDETAIQRAMDQYARLLWSVASVALAGVGTEQDTEECVADAFIYLWQNWETFDSRRGTLKTWLSVYTRSRAIDRRRRLCRLGTVSLEEVCPLPSRPETAEDREQLSRALAALEERDREIVLRRHVYRQRPRDIALALGMPVKQVRNRLYQSKLKLRALMDPRGGMQNETDGPK